MTTVVGIDPGLTSPGAARLVRPSGSGQWLPETWSIKTDGHIDDTLVERKHRLASISAAVLEFCLPCDFVVIEAPSYGSRGGSAWDRAHLWWRIVERLIGREVPVVGVAPTSRALWATGSGRSDKAAVSTAVGRMWPTAEIRNSDEADALALASIGLQILGERGPFEITAYRTRALAKVEVPDSLEIAA